MRGYAVLVVTAGMLLCLGAKADPVGYFGNVLTITRQGKLAGAVVYRTNHSYTMITTDSQIVDGRWAVKTGLLCLSPNRKEQGQFGLCVPDDPQHKAGDAWWVSPGGKPEELKLIAGP